MVKKTDKLYEGKAKILYSTDSADYVIQYFKDEATAFNAAKKGTIERKGIINNQISARIFEYLESQGIPTHFEKLLNDREMLIKKATMMPLEVVIRNRAAGSLCRVLGLKEGLRLACPIVEYCYKNDTLGDPIINETHVRALGLVSDEDMAVIKIQVARINDCLKKFFLTLKLELIDFKVEFGKHHEKVILADEISPDTCRLWEVGTGRKYDKDLFRLDLGNIQEAYQEVLNRVSA